MSVSFTKVTFVNDNNAVAVDATNLNAIENALQIVCDGGSGSGVDADTVREKILTNNLLLKKGLIANVPGGAGLLEYPDTLSPTYFQDEWRTVDSFTSPDSSATLSTSSGRLVLTPNASIELVIQKVLAGVQSKTLKLKIKNTGDLDGANAVRYLGNGGSTYYPLTLVASNDYYIATIETDAVAYGNLNLKIYLKAGSTAAQYIDWIYLGSGTYDFKQVSNTPEFPTTYYGTTPYMGDSFRELHFDGGNDKVKVNIPSSLSAFTCLIDVKELANTGTRTAFKLGDGESGVALTATSSGSSNYSLIFYRAGGTETLSNVVSLSGGTRYHIAVTCDVVTKAWALYVNGEYSTGGTLSNTPVAPTGGFYLGCTDSNTNWTKMSLLQSLVYSRILTEQEIWDLYKHPYNLEPLVSAFRVPAKAPETATSSGQVGEIRFDSSYVYICIADNTWKRATLASW